jgi:anti-sigma factor RsiW
MSCAAAKGLLEALVDGELDAGRKAEVAAHLESCSSCASELDGLRRLSTAVREPELRYQPPAWLESRVRTALQNSVATPKRNAYFPFWSWAALATCFVLAAALAWSVVSLQSRRPEREIIAREVVSSHLRSLLGNHLFDVPSTDQHTVKPWFDGKLDFSPDVKDLSSEGFRLAGGRLDYVDGRPVAALVFQRRLHTVNLFVWPSSGPESNPEPAPAQKGYNLVHWNAGGMTHWAVADIPVDELEQFGQLYRKNN